MLHNFRRSSSKIILSKLILASQSIFIVSPTVADNAASQLKVPFLGAFFSYIV